MAHQAEKSLCNEIGIELQIHDDALQEMTAMSPSCDFDFLVVSANSTGFAPCESF